MVKLRTLKSPLTTLNTRQGSVLPTAARYDDARRGSRHERGYGYDWVKRRARILARDGYRCLTCKTAGRVSAATTVDHIVEKADGGTDDDDNLQSLCGPCHDEKSAAERQRRMTGA